MVFRWFLPQQGGGQVRRYMRFRKQMFERILKSSDRHPCTPITLFDFANTDDATDAARVQEKDRDSWRISDDRVIGGFSEATATLIRNSWDYECYVSGEEQDGQELPSQLDGNSEPECSGNSDNFTPFIRWSGMIDTTVGLRSNVQRSGFAALRSPEFPMDGANLQGLYNALEIVCRSDGRLYTVNLKVASSIPDDIYQGQIRAPSVDIDTNGHLSGRFDTLVLPFTGFRLTSMGREREIHRELDDNVRIESIGVAIMDGRNGGFQFDLARIRAINLVDGRVFEGQPDEEAKMKN